LCGKTKGFYDYKNFYFQYRDSENYKNLKWNDYNESGNKTKYPTKSNQLKKDNLYSDYWSGWIWFLP
jgi:hypothetical protein